MQIGTYHSHPAADAFPMMTGEEFVALRDDIARAGQREPITRIWVQDPLNASKHQRAAQILDGRNRLRAVLELKLKPVFVDYEGDDPFGFVVSKNLARRHLTESQRALVAAKLAQLRAGANQHSEEVASQEATSQAKAAAALGVGRSSVQRARKVLEQGDAELVKAVERGDIDVKFGAELAGKSKPEQRALVRRVAAEKKKTGKVPNARQVLRAASRDAAAAVIEREPTPLPTGPFRVITADPPWAYDTRNDDGSRRGTTSYPTMTVEEIAALPVRERAHDDCVLWLWITNAHLIEGAHVPILEAWGFAGKTILTWVKDRPGLGNYLRNKTEHCILATRGRPTLQLTGQETVLFGMRREHSRKPPQFYELVDKLCPGSKLELFAREPRHGWQTWGAESEKFVEAAASRKGRTR